MRPMTSSGRERSAFALARRQPEFAFGSIMALATIVAVVGILAIFLLVTPMRDGATSEFVLVPSILGLLLVVNLGVAGVGLFIGWQAAALRHRLLRDGVDATGRVTKVARTMMRIKMRWQYRLHYTYRDSLGRSHAGTSGHMPEHEARSWRPDEIGAVRYDSQRPSASIWIGRAESAEA